MIIQTGKCSIQVNGNEIIGSFPGGAEISIPDLECLCAQGNDKSTFLKHIQYKVIGENKELHQYVGSSDDEILYYWGASLRYQFSLFGFTVEEVVKRWQEYSEKLCAGWLIPRKQSVEEVFHVTLEKIKQS